MNTAYVWYSAPHGAVAVSTQWTDVGSAMYMVTRPCAACLELILARSHNAYCLRDDTACLCGACSETINTAMDTIKLIACL